MNVRQTLRAMAVAIPMALVPSSKVAAQSANVVKAAENVVAADTVRALDAKAAEGRTLLLKSYKGHFKGNVAQGRIADGSLDYAEKGRTVPMSDFATSDKTKLTFDASVISGRDLVGPGFRMHAGAERSNNIVDVTGMYSTKSGTGRSTMMVDGSYTRAFPLGSGFDALGTVGTRYTVQREAFAGGDHHGVFSPELLGGIRYQHKFNNGVRVGAKGQVGGAHNILVKAEKYHPQTKTVVIANGEAEVGYKNVSLFANGGKDATAGGFVGGGARVTF